MKANITFTLIILALFSTTCKRGNEPIPINPIDKEPIKSAERSVRGKVTEVKDGDTFIFEWQEKKEGEIINKSEIIRSYGIDAPEIKQPYGKEAKDFLSNLILDKEITLFFKGKTTDKIERTVGIAFKDGVDINLETLKNGYAWHYKIYDNTFTYIEAERRAREQKKGLWKEKKPIPPWIWRKNNK